MFFAYAVLLGLFIGFAFMFEKQRTQKKILANLIQQINNLNLESAHTAWTAKQSKADIQLIKEAINLQVKEIA